MNRLSGMPKTVFDPVAELVSIAVFAALVVFAAIVPKFRHDPLTAFGAMTWL